MTEAGEGWRGYVTRSLDDLSRNRPLNETCEKSSHLRFPYITLVLTSYGSDKFSLDMQS
jgi:hypothetical protein